MVLLTGHHNELTRSLLPLLERDHEVCFIDADNHDLRDKGLLSDLVTKSRVDVIINLAFFGNIDEIEVNREIAYSLNGFAVRNIAEICSSNNIYLIHLSSSYVYNGTKGSPYLEGDLPDPISVFGDSKLLGEKYIAESGCEYLIIRASDILGSETLNIERFLRHGMKARVIDVPDRTISPVYSADLARAVFDLFEKRGSGIFHFSQEGFVREVEFFKTVRDLHNSFSTKKLDFTVNELDVREIPAMVDRPQFNVLDNSKYRDYTGVNARHWQDALKDYMKGMAGIVK